MPDQRFSLKTRNIISKIVIFFWIFMSGFMLGIMCENNLMNAKMLILQCNDYLNVVG